MQNVRRLLILLGLCLLMGAVSGAYAAQFADTANTPYATAFSSFGARGIVKGYGDGTARPYAAINRAEALKIVLKVFPVGARATVADAVDFTDVRSSDWFASSVRTAAAHGLVTGYGDGSFRPGNPLSTEEAVALLLRAAGENGMGGSSASSLYIENRSSQWFTPYINSAIAKNLIMHAGKLRLGSAITRGEFLDIAYRLNVVKATRLAAYAGAEPAPPPAAPSAPRVITFNPPKTAANPGTAFASEKFFSMTLPSLSITDLVVTHPQDPFSKQGILKPLELGVGHLFSYPGAGGKILVYGHSSGYPWDVSKYTKIFRKINGLKVGDKVYVTYQRTLHVYQVTKKQTVPADDTAAFTDNGTGEELILYTCWPPDSISQRYLVHAVPVSATALK